MKLKKAPVGDDRRCENCVRFYRHYFIPKYQEGGLMACDCGHCYHGRRRTTRPNRICAFLEMKEDTEAAVPLTELRLRILPGIKK